VVGVARGVTDHGQLVVEDRTGLHVVSAGDVVHLRTLDAAAGTENAAPPEASGGGSL
jgi:hypothetical protein